MKNQLSTAWFRLRSLTSLVHSIPAVTDFAATQQAREDTLETLVTLHPLALAMAATPLAGG